VEYYPRKLEEKLDLWMPRREAILIRGPRQSGKTTLLLHLKEKYGGSYVTLEDEDALRTFEQAPEQFASRYAEGRYLFLDEAQYCKEAGKTMKLIYDAHPELKVVATGSGSFDVKVEVGRYLVGRALYFELFPLDFEEFLSWRARDLLTVYRSFRGGLADFLGGKAKDLPSPAFQREFEELLEEYVVYGGFPAVVKEKEPAIKEGLLKALATTYLERDVFSFFGVREREKFKSLLDYLALANGSILEPSSLAQWMHADFRTLEGYLSVLTATYVMRMIKPYYSSLVTELKKAKKAYFLDNGLRNAIMGNFLPLSKRTDAGSLLEGFALEQLIADGYDVMYWRTSGGAEVDFVAIREEGRRELVPIEVKSGGREGRGLMSFVRAYSPRAALVLSREEIGVREINGTKIARVPHYFLRSPFCEPAAAPMQSPGNSARPRRRRGPRERGLRSPRFPDGRFVPLANEEKEIAPTTVVILTSSHL